jgi:regulator of sigma E protease
MDILNNVFNFLVVISILVVIHELGHFIAARLSKMRVEIFSLFMGYRLFGYNKKSGFSFGNLPEDFDGEGFCDYRLSLIPFGGYVKISGMIDESFDTAFAGKEPMPYEFRAKNPFQKAITISGGVIMNFLLAWAVFAIIVFAQGDTLFLTTKIGYVEKGSISEKIGLKAEDEIVSINSIEIKHWNQAIENMTIKDFGKPKSISLRRNNELINLNISGDSIVRALSNKAMLGIHPGFKSISIQDLGTMTPAGKAGMKPGDTILSINGEKIFVTSQMRGILSNFKNQNVFISWSRGGTIISDSVKPDENGLLGIQLQEAYLGPKLQQNFGLFTSLGMGWDKTIQTLGLFYNLIEQIFSGNMSAKSSLGGPIMIAKQASQSADMGIFHFLNFIGLLSVSLAVMNILPIPALDGGHLLIIIIEGVMRREIPLKIKMAIQQVGFVLIMGLIIFTIYIDIVR